MFCLQLLYIYQTEAAITANIQSIQSPATIAAVQAVVFIGCRTDRLACAFLFILQYFYLRIDLIQFIIVLVHYDTLKLSYFIQI